MAKHNVQQVNIGFLIIDNQDSRLFLIASSTSSALHQFQFKPETCPLPGTLSAPMRPPMASIRPLEAHPSSCLFDGFPISQPVKGNEEPVHFFRSYAFALYPAPPGEAARPPATVLAMYISPPSRLYLTALERRLSRTCLRLCGRNTNNPVSGAPSKPSEIPRASAKRRESARVLALTSVSSCRALVSDFDLPGFYFCDVQYLIRHLSRCDGRILLIWSTPRFWSGLSSSISSTFAEPEDGIQQCAVRVAHAPMNSLLARLACSAISRAMRSSSAAFWSRSHL